MKGWDKFREMATKTNKHGNRSAYLGKGERTGEKGAVGRVVLTPHDLKEVIAPQPALWGGEIP